MANLNLLGAIGGIGPGIQQGLQMKKQFQDLEHGENKINQEYELNEYKIEEHRKRNRKIPLNTILEGRDPEEVEILSTYFNPIKDSDGNISYGDFEAFRTSDTKNQFELNMNVARMNASKRKAEESKSQIFTLGQGIEDEIGQINIQGNPVSIQQILQLPSEDRESLISSIPDIETQERVRNQIEQMKVAYLDYDKYVKAEGVYAHKTGLIKNKEDKLVPVRIGDQIIYVPSSKAEGMEVGKVDSGQNIKNVTLDLPDPNGVKHAGGTMWDLSKGKPGSSEAFIGPAANKQFKDSKDSNDFFMKKEYGEIVKIREAAEDANARYRKLEDMAELAKKEGAGGPFNALKAAIGKALGIDTGVKGSDEQIRQILATAAGGGMRLEVIGPGPVSEFEQKILQSLFGVGPVNPSALLGVLDRMKNYQTDTINKYNRRKNDYYDLFPDAPKTFKDIKIEGNNQNNQTNTIKSFRNEDELNEAVKNGQIKSGDRISINGVSGTWR